MQKRHLKALLVLLAILEIAAFFAYALSGAPLNSVLAFEVLLVALLASLRYFWQRLLRRTAQFGNLLVAPTEQLDELDRWMLIGHLVVAFVAVPLVIA